jgi:hypothetical protein
MVVIIRPVLHRYVMALPGDKTANKRFRGWKLSNTKENNCWNWKQGITAWKFNRENRSARKLQQNQKEIIKNFQNQPPWDETGYNDLVAEIGTFWGTENTANQENPHKAKEISVLPLKYPEWITLPPNAVARWSGCGLPYHSESFRS